VRLDEIDLIMLEKQGDLLICNVRNLDLENHLHRVRSV